MVRSAMEVGLDKVRASTYYAEVILTTDTAIYAPGDVVADTQVMTAAMRDIDRGANLVSLVVIDQDDQKANLDIYFLSDNFSLGTENGVPAITDPNALAIMGTPIRILVADYNDLGGVSVAGKDAVWKALEPKAGTRDIYVAVVAGATTTPTFSATGLKLRIGLQQD